MFGLFEILIEIDYIFFKDKINLGWNVLFFRIIFKYRM